MSGLVLSWSNRKFQHKQEVPKLWQKATSLPPRNEKYPLLTITLYIFKLTLSTLHKRKSKNIVSNWHILNTSLSLSMFPVLHCDIPDHASCFTVLGPVSVSALRCHHAPSPAAGLATVRRYTPTYSDFSFTNKPTTLLFDKPLHCRNCRCWDSWVESVSAARHSLLCLLPWRRWPRLRLVGSVTSRNCVKTFGHNNFSFQGNIDVERAL